MTKLKFAVAGSLVAGACWVASACSSDPEAVGNRAAASGGSTGSGGGTGKTCGTMKVPSGCATSDAALTTAQCKTCHTADGGKLFKTIDFITDPKGSLLGKSAIYADLGGVVTPSTCPTQREILLDASNFDASLFVTKVRGSGFRCGGKMPQTFSMTAADQACILAWACELTQN